MAATLSQWVAAARLRTLPMAIAPVIVGSAAAAELGRFHLGAALLALREAGLSSGPAVLARIKAGLVSARF